MARQGKAMTAQNTSHSRALSLWIVTAASGAVALWYGLVYYPNVRASQVPLAPVSAKVQSTEETLSLSKAILSGAQLANDLARAKYEQQIERIRVSEESRRTAAQILLGSAVFVSILLAFRRVRAAEGAVRVSEEQQVTERFANAVQLLGDERPEVRLGGIYALERIARDSASTMGPRSGKDHWPTMEILCAYVRERTCATGLRVGDLNELRRALEDLQALPSESLDALDINPVELARTLKQRYAPSPDDDRTVSLDVQAALTVIGRCSHLYARPSGSRLDLTHTILRGADLMEARLEVVDFEGAVLTEADLTKAQMEGANLIGARLDGANLEEAWLFRAQLRGASLVSTRCCDAFMEEADMSNADLSDADFSAASLRKALFADAVVDGTIFAGADLSGAAVPP